MKARIVITLVDRYKWSWVLPYSGNLLTESVGEMGTIASGVVADPNWRY